VIFFILIFYKYASPNGLRPSLCVMAKRLRDVCASTAGELAWIRIESVKISEISVKNRHPKPATRCFPVGLRCRAAQILPRRHIFTTKAPRHKEIQQLGVFVSWWFNPWLKCLSNFQTAPLLNFRHCRRSPIAEAHFCVKRPFPSITKCFPAMPERFAGIRQ
jgi:hypothetical protein